MNPALLSSVDMDWQTPPEVLDLVRQVAPIGLDPCTTKNNPVGAFEWIWPEVANGLDLPWWPAHGLAFVNPPYGRQLAPWAAKIAAEGQRGMELICLVPARTDTRWWRNIETAARVCFWRGRIRFVGAPASAPFPSALGYWGPRPERFAEVFGARGGIWSVRP